MRCSQATLVSIAKCNMDMTRVIIVTYAIDSLLEIFTYIFCKAMPNKRFCDNILFIFGHLVLL